MKILVTGAAGFVGFHLINNIINDYDEIIGLDNINDYYDVNLKFDRLKEAGIIKEQVKEKELVQSTKYKNYCFVKADITDKEYLNKLFKTYKLDCVCHLAAQAGVRYSIDNPDVYIQSNIEGFFNILESCRFNPVKHLVYASSSSVYGLNKKQPFSVTDNVDHPISLYAATKKSNELMAYTYSHLYNIPMTGLRFFTVYGPWGRPDMAYTLFAKAISEKKSINIFNNGNLSRDFTYIDDIVEGVKRVLKIPPEESQNNLCKYELYNIGKGTPVNLMDFITTIESEMGKEAIKKYLPMQPGDVETTFADVSTLKEKINYIPSVSIEEGIKSYISWFREYYK